MLYWDSSVVLTAVLTPKTLPSLSMIGPPLFPSEMAAVIKISLSVVMLRTFPIEIDPSTPSADP